MDTNSSKTTVSRALAQVSVSEARSFLSELANLRDETAAAKKFLLRFLPIWPGPGHRGTWIGFSYAPGSKPERISYAPGSKPENDQVVDMLRRSYIPPIREVIRVIWTAPDLRTRQWAVFRILYKEIAKQNITIDVSQWWSHPNPIELVRLPPPTPFEQVLLYLLRPGVYTAVCANPECPAPYFFPSRRGQKYCATICALPSQREFKRKWWNAKGKALRRKYAKARSLKKGK